MSKNLEHKPLRKDISKMFKQIADDIETMPDDYFIHIIQVLQSMRIDIKNGRYGDKIKNLNWGKD